MVLDNICFHGWALTFFSTFCPDLEDYTCYQHYYQSVTMVNLLLFIVFVVLFLFFLVAHYIFCYLHMLFYDVFYQSSIPFLKCEFFNLFNRMSNRLFTKPGNFYCIWYFSISISVVCNISFCRHCYMTYSFILFQHKCYS